MHVLLEWDHRGLGLGTTHRLGGRRRLETLRLSKAPKSRKVVKLEGSLKSNDCQSKKLLEVERRLDSTTPQNFKLVRFEALQSRR